MTLLKFVASILHQLDGDKFTDQIQPSQDNTIQHITVGNLLRKMRVMAP